MNPVQGIRVVPFHGRPSFRNAGDMTKADASMGAGALWALAGAAALGTIAVLIIEGDKAAAKERARGRAFRRSTYRINRP